MPDIEELFLTDTGEPLQSMFSSFDANPIGSASLAQVHKARLRETGREVAVKIQHPSLDEFLPVDMKTTRLVFEAIKWVFPQYSMTWLSDGWMPAEKLDFDREAANIKKTRDYFKTIGGSALCVPNAYFSKRRILVMECVRLDDLGYMREKSISRDEVAAELARIFNEMIFGRNSPGLHCDPHGAIRAKKRTAKCRKNFEIILYDHGLYRKIPLRTQRSYAKLWLAIIDSDEPAMRKYSKEVANISDEKFPLFASAITGRDYGILKKSIDIERSDAEKDHIGQGLLGDLIGLLANVPRLILLILKTNDLTRSLDESLQTTSGPKRGFLILGKYCARCVYEEECESLETRGFWRPSVLLIWLRAWAKKAWIDSKLSSYEWGLYFSGIFSMRLYDI